jgi:putative oxidoreductase
MTNQNLGLLVFRLLAGGVMLTHGYQKFANFAEYATQFPDPLGVGAKLSLSLVVFAELVCAAFVVVGLFTRLALIPLIVTMIVAFFIIHGADPFIKKELALMYLGLYGGLFLTGPGDFSVQGLFRISAGRFSWLLK